MILDAGLRERLDRLSLATGGRVRSTYAGRHASRHLGESLDFADYREYTPGDDFRRIDHQLWARLGQVLVRRYEAEEDLTVSLVVDTTASMGFGRKFETARLMAGIVAYLALARGDRIIPLSLTTGGDDRRMRGPTGRHRSAWPSVERWLEELQPAGTTPLAPSIRGIAGSTAGKGAVVVVSDLLDREWERALDGAGLGVGGVVVHVLDVDEIEPRLVGDLRLVDSETRNEMDVSPSSEATEAYASALESFVRGAAQRSRRVGLDHVLVPATDGAAERLLRALATSGAVR